MKSTLFINTKAPYSTQATKESLDAAMASAAFGVEVGMLFLGDGVFQITKGQNPAPDLLKRTAPIFQSLDLYDISKIFVCEEDLIERGLNGSDLLINVSVIPNQEVSAILTAFDHLLTF